MKISAKSRVHYSFIFPIQTHWADNDMYGHVNNVTYYSYFDSAANALLIKHTGFDIHHSDIIGLVVESQCQFLQELSYPEVIEVGVMVEKIGNSSLRYDLAIFKQNQANASAQGAFTHVFVDRKTRKSVPISIKMRDALSEFIRKT